MYGLASRNSSKPRHSKLRASCDTCFLAKIKCSKSRPICSRCLACGADCCYSPSSRAGKPKSDGKKSKQSSISRDMSIPEASNTSTIAYTSQSMNIDDGEHASYGLEIEWLATPVSADGRMNRLSISSAVMPIIGEENASEAESSRAHTDILDPCYSWTDSPRTDITSPYIDNSLLPRSRSLAEMSVSPPSAPWFDQVDYTNFSSSAPGLGPAPNTYMSNSMAKTPACNCFNTCLRALQELHNSSAITSGSPFDVTLTVNQKAVEGCTIMLSCPICISKSGSSVSTLLLGTIIGKVISIYQDASKNYFGLTPGPGSQIQPLPLTFGTYRVAGEDRRWLEVEIILRELKKLKELFAKFRETSKTSESEEDARMHSVVTNYLCQRLQLTFEILENQKNITYG